MTVEKYRYLSGLGCFYMNLSPMMDSGDTLLALRPQCIYFLLQLC